jgi:hypothetical protein
VKNTFDAMTCLGHCFGIVNIGLNKVHRFKPEQIVTLSGDKVVDATDFLASRQQLRCDRPADEAGSASY